MRLTLLLIGHVVLTSLAYGQTGPAIYTNYCSGCHGKEMQGSIATALIKKTWEHGGDKASIVKTISNGVPDTEMGKWSGVLTQQQIEAVADYIIKAQLDPEIIKKIEKPLNVQTKLYNLKIERLVEGLNGPWGFDFVDANRAIVSGKFGELNWIVNGKLDKQPITGLPKSYAADNWGGMLDVAIDPNYAKNGWIYLAFSHNPKNSTDKMTPGMTKIVRGKVNGHQWTNEQTLFQVADSLLLGGRTRWGCRFLFDKEGHLFFTIGDMDQGPDAQILTRPAGKIYRINPDGSIPKDNPFAGNKKGYLEAIYTYGNRNAQGIAQHPVTGLIYASEHGPKGGDELNIIKSGANYGWPLITFGIGYDDKPISNETSRPGMEQPITYWTPSIAVSSIEFVTGAKFPKWQNNLIVTALAFEEVRRLVIDKDKVTEQEILLKGYGRVRDVKVGPDGALYVLTNAPDALLRITPQ